MSRNRVAILADIEKHNLNPSIPHRKLRANGHLAHPAKSVESFVSEEQKVVREALQFKEEEKIVNVEPNLESNIEHEQVDEKQIDENNEQSVKEIVKKKNKKQIIE